MDSRLSRSTQDALSHAREEALHLGSEAVGTEHLLLGLLAGHATHAARVLLEAGATLDGCRSKVSELTGPAASKPRGSRLELTDRARRTLERADRLSLRRRATHVEPEHVLVSLLDVEGRAGQVLRGLGVDLGPLRDAAAAEVGQPAGLQRHAASPEDAVAEGEAVTRAAPRCASCGADLVDGGLAHRIVDSSSETGAPRHLLLVHCAACGAVVGAYPEP